MTLIEAAQLTLTSPRQGLRAVLGLGLTMRDRMAALALVAVASAVLLHLSISLMPLPQGNPLVDMLASSPFRTAAVQVGMLLVMAILVQGLGQVFGGQGRWPDALLTVVWLQGFFVALQAAQLIALVVLPPLSDAIGLVSIVLFFWLLTQFVTELHGFSSPIKVLLGIILAGVALSFLLSVLLIGALGPEAFVNV